jgi:hypothetical protein
MVKQNLMINKHKYVLVGAALVLLWFYLIFLLQISAMIEPEGTGWHWIQIQYHQWPVSDPENFQVGPKCFKIGSIRFQDRTHRTFKSEAKPVQIDTESGGDLEVVLGGDLEVVWGGDLEVVWGRDLEVILWGGLEVTLEVVLGHHFWSSSFEFMGPFVFVWFISQDVCLCDVCFCWLRFHGVVASDLDVNVCFPRCIVPIVYVHGF